MMFGHPSPLLQNLSRNEQICYIQVCEPKKKTASTLLKYGNEKPNIKYNIKNPAHGKLEQWLSATLPPTMQNYISE